MKHALEAAAIFACMIGWLLLQSWPVPTKSVGDRKFTISRQYVRQFSVRSLLITTTLVAVMFGLVAWLVR